MAINLSAANVLAVSSAKNVRGTKVIQYLHEVLDVESMFYIKPEDLKEHAFQFLAKNMLITEEIVYINRDRDTFIQSILAANLDTEGSIIKNAMLTQQDTDDISQFFDGLDKALTPRVANKLNSVKDALEANAHADYVQHIKDKYTLAISSTDDQVTNSDFQVKPQKFGFLLQVAAPFEYNFRFINLFHPDLFALDEEDSLASAHALLLGKKDPRKVGLKIDKDIFCKPDVYDALVAIRENVDSWLTHAEAMADKVKDRSAKLPQEDPFKTLFNSL